MKRLILLAALALAGCGGERPAIAKPPIALMTCADEPSAPDLPDRSDQDARDRLTLEYLLSLRSAWGDCHSKVSGVRAWAEGVSK